MAAKKTFDFMETMDLSKNFPQEYVNKRIDKKMICLSAVSLAVGCYLFSLPEFAPGSNVDAFRFCRMSVCDSVVGACDVQASLPCLC